MIDIEVGDVFEHQGMRYTILKMGAQMKEFLVGTTAFNKGFWASAEEVSTWTPLDLRHRPYDGKCHKCGRSGQNLAVYVGHSEWVCPDCKPDTEDAARNRAALEEGVSITAGDAAAFYREVEK